MTDPAYGSPAVWAAGPDRVYRALAEAAIALIPDISGSLALDAGAGTAAVAAQLRRRGAAVVELDISEAMLRHDRGERPMAIVGDATALPLRDGCVDLAVAGFVLSHLDDPERGLGELVRVTRLGGIVLITAFPAGPDVPGHPAKVAVDDVLRAYGYEAPEWYLELKSAGEERVGSRSALGELAAAVGLVDAVAEQVDVDISAVNVDVLVRWRLGMAQVAPWLAAQAPDRQEDIRRSTRDALQGVPATPLAMLVLRGSRSGTG
jgi:SAM-dependent methyltransferase